MPMGLDSLLPNPKLILNLILMKKLFVLIAFFTVVLATSAEVGPSVVKLTATDGSYMKEDKAMTAANQAAVAVAFLGLIFMLSIVKRHSKNA